jgi:hypothetical protein
MEFMLEDCVKLKSSDSDPKRTMPWVAMGVSDIA